MAELSNMPMTRGWKVVTQAPMAIPGSLRLEAQVDHPCKALHHFPFALLLRRVGRRPCDHQTFLQFYFYPLPPAGPFTSKKAHDGGLELSQ